MGLIAEFNSYDDNAVASGADWLQDLEKIRTVVNGAIEAVNLAALAVTNAKIANDAVTSSKIQDGAVTTAKLDTGAVTEAKIASGAVTNDKVGSGSLDGDRIGTATMGLGTGADGTKAGPIKGIYMDVTFNVALGTAVNIPHNLGTNNMIGFIVLDVVYPSAPTGGDPATLYDFTVVDTNTVSLKCALDTSSFSTDFKLLILYY